MTTPRVIKKYPNRRLYDSEESRYITLADIRDLVLHGAGFVVIDKKTGQNITRTILLQVIIEREQHGEAIMSEDFLAQVIRAHGKMVPGGEAAQRNFSRWRSLQDDVFRRFVSAHGETADDGSGLCREPRGHRKKAG